MQIEQQNGSAARRYRTKGVRGHAAMPKRTYTSVVAKVAVVVKHLLTRKQVDAYVDCKKIAFQVEVGTLSGPDRTQHGERCHRQCG